MKRIKYFLALLAVSAAAVLVTAGPASADATVNNGHARAIFISYGDQIGVTAYDWDPDMPQFNSWAEWYTSYGRTGTCGPNSGGTTVTCFPNVAENRTIHIRVCSTVSLFPVPPTCSAYKSSPT
ncbi:hypothetical protein ACFYT4_34790 [Streptomyces sp. NPDC004609]|uniref:hypothetical protein n=1 Tax=Streptomyces sp. NPDC004609 TaxID=3364704 RepID=UPI0036A60419